ncbi:TetR/AcrR family transcriptional regulator [Mesorhizobium sp. M7A.F.Ca.US.006.01.1.1]|uniref:TetR/AcrR family transcriptional regulator n=1 Tax=Mesorhizobium sp. M7A.F.Ca.US.006.01.1.1 TaxID=2496707 RepID=UPI0013E3D6C4|nr:TetR/AcrR family transcriptional regulator [Mesorhizobium sp. M7A.F.Ca.US.006.01.1.1]
MNEVRSAPRHQLVRDEILTKAAEVFERQGFAQTRLEDIATVLSLKRSAIYYYFKTKNDILHALVEDYAERKAREMEDLVTDHKGSAIEKLQVLLSVSVLNRTLEGPRVRALDTVATEMPAKTKAIFEQARRRILNLHVGVIREGIEQGELRAVDPTMAALAVLGVANWTSWWYSPTGRQRPEELARSLADIALNGLARSEIDRSQGQQPLQIIDLIQRDLGELRRAIAG